MAGYIGSKAVNLSTTGADIAGDADVSGALDVGGAFTSQGIDDNATSTAMTLDASGNVGIGTSSPYASNGKNLEIYDASTIARLSLHTGSGKHWGIGSVASDSRLSFYDIDSSSEAMRIDSSGRLYVGTTNTAPAINNVAGFVTINGAVQSSVSGGISGYFNRMSTDGNIVQFRKDGTTVGSIGSRTGNDIYLNSGSSGRLSLGGSETYGWNSSGIWAVDDNLRDLGYASLRWNDAYIKNGVTTGSDGNDKQDIRDLTEAEQRVAVACKGLLKAWRWKSAVEEKGDNARIHCGIIAQDLQAAFAAEGLDAGRYAMFMSNTWWETQTEVPAVDAVAEVTETTTDEDGNEVVTVVTEAVEAVDAYTRTDTYETQEEAPEGATERTRLGVRYSELLAFMIGAL